VSERVIALHEIPEQVQGLQFTNEPQRLRFFQARFETVGAHGMSADTGRPERALAMS